MPNKHLYHLLNSYTPLPIKIVKGKGGWLFDHNNRRYLDLIAGMGVTLLGHANPRINFSIKKQLNLALHLSNLVMIPQQAELAKKLVKYSNITTNAQEKPVKVFFTNSGAEAVETALKLTRLYANFKHIKNPKIITMHNAYHGRTIAAMSASDNPEFSSGFEPLLPNFIRVAFNDIATIQKIVTNGTAKNIVAIMLEPIQGEGGIRVADPDYLSKIQQICRQQQWLLILDEIQTGLGRTGKMFCYQHYKVKPDVLLIAKGLANGVPIGACIIKQPFANLFKPKSHGSTFGGNPLACSTAITTLDIICQQKLWNNAKMLGKYFLNELHKCLGKNPKVTEIRGKGLMLGIELIRPYQQLMQLALKHQVLFNVTRNNVIRLLPPLTIDKASINLAVTKIAAVINDL